VTGLIARLGGASGPHHAALTVAKAESAGFEDVSMTYRPASETFEVRGTLPDDELSIPTGR
jgi:hypothetical protein